jgi:hypothetical protein
VDIASTMLWDYTRPLATQVGLWKTAHRHQLLAFKYAQANEHVDAAAREAARAQLSEVRAELVRRRRLRRVEIELDCNIDAVSAARSAGRSSRSRPA